MSTTRKEFPHLLTKAKTSFLLVGAVIALLLVACNYRIATQRPPEAGMEAVGFLALAHGVLSGEVNLDGTACFWLGNAAQRTVLKWPAGYTAGGTPLSVRNEKGSRVAVVGQFVSLAGGLAPGGTSVAGCYGFAEVWLVSWVTNE